MGLFSFLTKDIQSIQREIKTTVTGEPSWYGLFDPYNGANNGSPITPIQAVDFFQYVAPVNGAVKRLANSVAGLPIILVDKSTNERVTKHPLLDLLRKPNSQFQMTRKQFFRDFTIWNVLEGDTYCAVTGKGQPIEMFVLNPLNVQLYTDSKGFIDKIEYRPGGGGNIQVYSRDMRSDRFYNDSKTVELLRMSNFTTEPDRADQGGMSEIGPLYYEIYQYIKASEHNLTLLTNGARPSGAFVWKGEGAMSDDALKRLRSEIQATISGSSNAGRPILLEGDLDFKEMSVNPKDGDFRQNKNDAEQQIYKILGVPLEMSGNASSVSANNMINIRREFYQNRVVPLLEDQLEYLTVWLLSRYKESDNLELQVDKQNIDVFIEEQAAKQKLIDTNTTMTINEKRKAVRLSPIKSGNKIVDPNGRPVAGEDAFGEVGFGTQNSDIVDPVVLPPIQ
jgi:HK97 family phage portal protein